MATHKYIDRICLAAALLSLLAAMLLFSRGTTQSDGTALGYESRLFDTGRVHTIDIVMDDWDAFLETCENEEYASCAVVIDGEAYKNIGIRAKGNTSLSMVSSLGSDRYSFKLEFDQYDTGRTYYGLDKLCLNNLIQDNTCMKDYLVYQMMSAYDVDAPLCSYVYITVNGQDWGLYLAVEGVEEGFLQRTGNSRGELYKPDSLSMGGGRGNGRDFHMDDFGFGENEGEASGSFRNRDNDTGTSAPNAPPEGRPEQPDSPEGAPVGLSGSPEREGGFPERPGFSGGGMGAADVKLQYIDDDPDSYANIFDSAKTDISNADQGRLIAALKALGEHDTSALDVDQVLRYFVVHNYVCNGDSYTGNLVHNYYLYEEEGRLAMIPWDYNLAFGGFESGNASGVVNDPIDTPQSVTGSGDRPMIDWIFSDAAYTEQYHQYFAEFLEAVDPAAIISETAGLIAPYVEKDPTKFCTYEEFQTGVQALAEFCRLRTESVAGQLAGDIPATSDGQAAEPSALVDASSLNLTDMGSMGHGGGGFGGNRAALGRGDAPPSNGTSDQTGAALFNSIPGQPEAAPANGNTPGLPDETSAERDHTAPMTFPGERGTGGPPDFPGSSSGEASLETETFILLGVSVLILLAGLLLLKRYRRWGV